MPASNEGLGVIAAPPYTEIVTKTLEQAQQYAKSLQTGAQVEVTLLEVDHPENILYVDLMGPFQFHAEEYGLEFVSCNQWTFTFTKL